MLIPVTLLLQLPPGTSQKPLTISPPQIQYVLNDKLGFGNGESWDTPSPSYIFLPRRSCPRSPDWSVSSTQRSIVTQAQPVRRHATGRTLGGSFECKTSRVFGRKHGDTGVAISHPPHLRNHAFPPIERRWIAVDQDKGYTCPLAKHLKSRYVPPLLCFYAHVYRNPAVYAIRTLVNRLIR